MKIFNGYYFIFVNVSTPLTEMTVFFLSVIGSILRSAACHGSFAVLVSHDFVQHTLVYTMYGLKPKIVYLSLMQI